MQEKGPEGNGSSQMFLGVDEVAYKSHKKDPHISLHKMNNVSAGNNG